MINHINAILTLALLLLIPGSCARESQPNHKNEISLNNTQTERDESVIPFAQPSSLPKKENRKKDLNHDGFADSLAWNENTNLLSLYFGGENGAYTLFKEWIIPLAQYELSADISGDSLLFSAEGILYVFQYRDNDLYLTSYTSEDFCEPSYTLDFERRKLTLHIEDFLGNKEQSTMHYPSIDMPKQIAQNITVGDCFINKKDIGIHILYEDDFIKSKIDSFSKNISCGYLADGTECVNNEARLSLRCKGAEGEVLMLSFDKTGVSKKRQLVLEEKMRTMLSDPEGLPCGDIIGGYVWRQKEMTQGGHNNLGGSFSIEEIFSENGLSTFCIKGNTKDLYVTFNQVDDLLYPSYIEKKNGLKRLLIEGLKDYFEVKTDDELLKTLSPRIKSLEGITFPEDPFIHKNDLVYRYQRGEITQDNGERMPESRIPLDKALPYFKQIGKDFLNHKRQGN